MSEDHEPESAEEAGYRVCPSCGEEFTLATTRCGDCGVDLVAPGEIVTVDASGEDLPPAEDMHRVRVAPVSWTRALSQALEAQDIPHRVQPVPHDQVPQEAEDFDYADLFGTYVEDENLPLAEEIDTALASQIVPQDGSTLGEGEVDECPACGSPLSGDVGTCAECGLEFME